MPDARIGITNAEIAGILEDVDAFVERYGYRPDLEQLHSLQDTYEGKYADILEKYVESDGLLVDFEENGTYVVAVSAELELSILSNSVVFVDANSIGENNGGDND